ncbi:hypothetical protein [Hymenobacter sp. BT730]|uniref:hypothetical protein n=1 Tax=Hymenobacter sp. BT730 TaxID=3063332 RepID=UPI0026DEFBD0|nr:hypothetical protein [Hymenobacter sp. BT730]
MKAAVTLRLCDSSTDFQVFFPYSDVVIRTALLTAGIRCSAPMRGYVLPATPEAVAQLQTACAPLGHPLIRRRSVRNQLSESRLK